MLNSAVAGSEMEAITTKMLRFTKASQDSSKESLDSCPVLQGKERKDNVMLSSVGGRRDREELCVYLCVVQDSDEG